MPRTYKKKTETADFDVETVVSMLKAIKMENVKPFTVAKQFDVTKDRVYRLVAAFDKGRATNEPITEETLKSFANTRNKKGGQTVSSL